MKILKPKFFTKRTFPIKTMVPFHLTRVMEDNHQLKETDKTISDLVQINNGNNLRFKDQCKEWEVNFTRIST